MKKKADAAVAVAAAVPAADYSQMDMLQMIGLAWSWKPCCMKKSRHSGRDVDCYSCCCCCCSHNDSFPSVACATAAAALVADDKAWTAVAKVVSMLDSRHHSV